MPIKKLKGSSKIEAVNISFSIQLKNILKSSKNAEKIKIQTIKK